MTIAISPVGDFAVSRPRPQRRPVHVVRHRSQCAECLAGPRWTWARSPCVGDTKTLYLPHDRPNVIFAAFSDSNADHDLVAQSRAMARKSNASHADHNPTK